MRPTLRSSSLAVTLTLLAHSCDATRLIQRQNVPAKCAGSYGDGTFDWLYCPSREDPCAVYNSIVADCGSPPALALSGAGAEYPVLTTATANTCSCSPEANNLLAACAYCQGFAFPSFSAYKAVCTEASTLNRSGLPNWAPNNPNGNDMWDVDQARITATQQCVIDLPPLHDPTTTSTTVLITTDPPTSRNSTPIKTDPTPNPTSTKTNPSDPGDTADSSPINTPGPVETTTTSGELEVPSVTPSPSMLPATLATLQSCSCPSQDCSYRNAQRKEQRTYKVLVGAPLRNCEGSRTNLVTTFALTGTVTETWSVSAELGILAGPVTFSVSTGWSRSVAQSLSQSTEAEVEPNTKARFVADVLYDVTEGELYRHNTKIGMLTSNQPNTVQSYEVQIVACNQSFVGEIPDTPPKAICDAASTILPRGATRYASWLLVIALCGILSP